jgi:outer membrane protein assembly factor BamB
MVQINPSQRGKLPPVSLPITFQTKDGRLTGWKASLPGGHPLATPAVLDGQVFLGGGFGSYEFYALDAATGQLVWQYQTTDDGPTAAVAWEGFVVFSTESCELEVVTTHGRPVWKHWLGDPLMSMPAVGDGYVYASFPDGKGDHQHYLAAFDIRSGRESWRNRIDAEVITAPVLHDGQVYLTNLAGTLFSFRQKDGAPLLRAMKDATSSPMIWNRECYFSQRREQTTQAGDKPETYQTEHVVARGIDPDGSTQTFAKSARRADYLDHIKRMRGSPVYQASASLDAKVGFAGHKGDAKMFLAMKHLGRGHVHEIWSYQGSKPFIHRGCLYSAAGDTVQSLDPVSREVHWERRLGSDRGDQILDNVLTPPATVNGKLFLGSIFGEVYCLSAESGDLIWQFKLDEAIAFPPAVAGGRVYVPTNGGNLYCVETGDPRDDGWYMWGATAAHNGCPGQ